MEREHGPDLISRQEAAGVLGISLDTLDRLIGRGVLVAYRIGLRRVMVDRASLEDYLAKCRIAS